MKKQILALFCLLILDQSAQASDPNEACIQNAIDNVANDNQLFIQNCNLEDDDIPTITQFLQSHPSFIELYLDNNNIGDEGAKKLAEINLNILSIDNNKIGPLGAAALAKSKTLDTIWIESNRIGDKGVGAFANDTILRSLYVSDDGITSAGAKLLSANDSLISLEISSNQIGDEGLTALAHAKNLTTLGVNNNQINDIGATAIAQSTTINWLELGDNQITDQGALALAVAKGSAGKYLYIAHNLLTDAGVASLKNSPMYSKVCASDTDCLSAATVKRHSRLVIR